VPKFPSKILLQSSERIIKSRKTRLRITLCLPTFSLLCSFTLRSICTLYPTTRQNQFGMNLRKVSSNGTKYTFWNVYSVRNATKITNAIISSVMREYSGNYSNYLTPNCSATRPIVNKWETKKFIINVLPVHGMKSYERMEILPQIFLKLLNRRKEAIKLNHRLLHFRWKIPQTPTDWEAMWALNPVWTLRRKNKFSYSLQGIELQFIECTARSLVTILTELSRLIPQQFHNETYFKGVKVK